MAWAIDMLTRRPLFAVVFVAFAGAAALIAARSPIGPGQDQHYHLMGAALTARGWVGDPTIRALYQPVNPLDANTLIYTWLFPFEALLREPVAAWKVGFTALYFIGYPLACAASLALMRRPLWGALLAFPLAYVKTWSHGGFIPFISAAPFFVLAVGAMHRALDSGVPVVTSKSLSRRGACVVAGAASLLTVLAHGHAYTWLMMVLAVATLGVMVTDVVPGVVQEPASSLRAAVVTGLRSLATVSPSLVLFGLWYWRTHRGAHATSESTWAPSTESLEEKVRTLPSLLVHTRPDEEWGYLAALTVLVSALVLLLPRRRKEVPTPEIAVLLSVASYWLLPFFISGQSIALRQIDFAVWLLPLVVLPLDGARSRARLALAVTAIIAFSALRLSYLDRQLRRYQEELKGMLAISKAPCPPGAGEVAYVDIGSRMSVAWHGDSLHQAHETLAARCHYDAPVYDPTVYPHNLLPIRYRGKPPAPIMIIENDLRFYARADLWRDFEYVVVRGWRPGPADETLIGNVATLERHSGDWRLYRRKRSSP